jgi:hypothetical protein
MFMECRIVSTLAGRRWDDPFWSGDMSPMRPVDDLGAP